MIEAVKKYVEALPENANHAVEMRMSSAGDCPRKLEYDKLIGPEPISFQNYLRMESGKKIHEMLTHLFMVTFGPKFHSVDRDVSVTIGGITIPGHPDGVLDFKEDSLITAENQTVIEFKSCSDHTYQKIANENKPLDQHIEQAALYAVAVGVPWATIIYMNRQTCELMIYTFEGVKDIVDALTPRIARVIKNWAAGEIGPRPYHDKTESPCWFCGHKDRCYEGFKAEVEGAGTAKLTNELLYNTVKEMWANRTNRLTAEKLETSLKAQLGSMIYGTHKLKQVVLEGTPSYFVNLKTGKNDNLLVEVKENE